MISLSVVIVLLACLLAMSSQRIQCQMIRSESATFSRPSSFSIIEFRYSQQVRNSGLGVEWNGQMYGLLLAVCETEKKAISKDNLVSKSKLEIELEIAKMLLPV